MSTVSRSNPFPFSMKIAVVALIMAATLGYSILRKRHIDKLTNSENNLILKEIPRFEIPGLDGGFVTPETLFKGGNKAALVHFWGTWCGPCEAELPEFIEFVRQNQDKGVTALLLAVQDDDVKIKKYLKRYGRLPDNIILAHDKVGSSMMTFGTVKVPETYLFASSGKNLFKFVGPQTWSLKAIQNRLEFYLSSIGNTGNSDTGSAEEKKIETH